MPRRTLMQACNLFISVPFSVRAADEPFGDPVRRNASPALKRAYVEAVVARWKDSPKTPKSWPSRASRWAPGRRTPARRRPPPRALICQAAVFHRPRNARLRGFRSRALVSRQPRRATLARRSATRLPLPHVRSARIRSARSARRGSRDEGIGRPPGARRRARDRHAGGCRTRRPDEGQPDANPVRHAKAVRRARRARPPAP